MQSQLYMSIPQSWIHIILNAPPPSLVATLFHRLDAPLLLLLVDFHVPHAPVVNIQLERSKTLLLEHGVLLPGELKPLELQVIKV